METGKFYRSGKSQHMGETLKDFEGLIGNVTGLARRLAETKVGDHSFARPVCTGLSALDKVLGPLRDGRVVCVEGSSYDVHCMMGTIAANMASLGHPVLYCMHEDRYEDALAALVAGQAHVPVDHIRRDELDEDERRAVEQARSIIGSWDMRLLTWNQSACLGLCDLHRFISEISLNERQRSDKKRVVVIEAIDWEFPTLGYLEENMAISPLSYLATILHVPLVFGAYSSTGASDYDDSRLLEHAPDVHGLYACVHVQKSIREPGLLDVHISREWLNGCVDDVCAICSSLERVADCVMLDFREEAADWWKPEEAFLRHKIFEPASPFEDLDAQSSVAARSDQWFALRRWGTSECPRDLDPVFEREGFVPFLAYELGYAEEADAFYRQAGHCKMAHGQWMALIDGRPEAEAVLLMVLLRAFTFMSEYVRGQRGLGAFFRIYK